MFRKTFTLIMLMALTGALALAQDAPKTEKKDSKEKKASRAYSFSFGGGSSYLGIHMKEVTKDNYSEFGLSDVRGVAVNKVVEDSPAAKAGFKKGDVLVRFNGESVTSVRKLRRLISEVAPDHTAQVTVVRGGSEQNFSVKMGKRRGMLYSTRAGIGSINIPEIVIPRMPTIPRTPRSPKAPVIAFGMGRTIGVSVTPLSKQLGDYFGVSDGKGLLVKDVRKDSPAAKAGLKAGDVIVEVDGKKVSRTFDLMRAVGAKKEGDVKLTVVRDKQSREINVTPEKSEGKNRFFFREGDFGVWTSEGENND